MSDRAPYSRVYWSIVDDERFAHVYNSPVTLGTWLQLLLIADQAFPASARIPEGTNHYAVKKLVESGLIVVQPSKVFRVHGLEAERARRSAAATTRGPNGTQTVPRRDEPRQDETSRGRARRDGAPRELSFDERVEATKRMLREIRGDA